jgi:GTP1/Obg family GTP-binding protein
MTRLDYFYPSRYSEFMKSRRRTITQAEAQRRIREAQQILEHRVQAGLGDVAQKLGNIIWCPEYREVHKLYSRVKKLWYKLDSRALSTKIDLDNLVGPDFIKKVQEAQKKVV